jgi:hypothetical protein
MELVAIGLMTAFRETMAYKYNCGATGRQLEGGLTDRNTER